MNIILIFDRIINKLAKEYREYVFKAKTGYRPKIYGKVHLINKNVRLGKNVSLYPGVMIFGDGPVEIGDHVNIGNGTLIYASKSGGG